MYEEIEKIRMKLWCDVYVLCAKSILPEEMADEALEHFDKRFKNIYPITHENA